MPPDVAPNRSVWCCSVHLFWWGDFASNLPKTCQNALTRRSQPSACLPCRLPIGSRVKRRCGPGRSPTARGARGQDAPRWGGVAPAGRPAQRMAAPSRAAGRRPRTCSLGVQSARYWPATRETLPAALPPLQRRAQGIGPLLLRAPGQPPHRISPPRHRRPPARVHIDPTPPAVDPKHGHIGRHHGARPDPLQLPASADFVQSKGSASLHKKQAEPLP
jgi:hypothetical protein